MCSRLESGTGPCEDHAATARRLAQQRPLPRSEVPSTRTIVADVRAPDPAFAYYRLADLYDVFDGDRSDLSIYEAIVCEVGAASVLDIGCGTGSLAVGLALQGLRVVGVDPALASLEVAKRKPGADQVEWVHGDATTLNGRPVDADLAVMTGNVAQVFVDDADWSLTLDAVRHALRADGWFVLETCHPEARDWEHWNVDPTTIGLPGGKTAVTSRTVTSVELPLVTFETSTVTNGESVHSTSTLRFRGQDEIGADLVRHGCQVLEVREAPDRPGKELVFLAQRQTQI